MSKVVYVATLGALSVFGRRIKGVIHLGPEQVWTCKVTRNYYLLLSASFHSDASVLEEWCESVVLCRFLSVFVIVK
jgi:accessory colonization factor AcfC